MTTFQCPSDILFTTVYNAMEHVTQKSPGPMCGWVGRILHPDSCIWMHDPNAWCLPDPKCLFDPSGLSLCLPGDHFCTVPVDDMVLFHSMVSDGGLVSNTTLPTTGGSGLCAGCEGIHFFMVLLHPQARWFLGHVLHRVVNSQQHVNKMSDGHQNVVIR